MRVLHCCDSVRLVEGGVARAVHDLVAVLDRRGNYPMLLTSGQVDRPVHWGVGDEDRLYRVDNSTWSMLWPSQLQKCLISNAINQASVVHIHVPWSLLSIRVAKICRQLGVPYCVSLHGCLDDWPMAQKPLRKRLAIAVAVRPILESAAFVHCTAEDEVRQSKKWFPKGVTRVVPCVMDLSPYRELPGTTLARSHWNLDSQRKMLLHIGRIHPKKGLLLLVRAMPVLLRTHDVWLCVAGPREDADYAATVDREIQALGLTGRVRFLGNVADPQLKASLYQCAAVTVLPSSQENFGFVMFEAIVCGSRLVTSDKIDTWRELRDRGGATVCAPNAVEIARSVCALLDSQSQESQHSQFDGRDWVLQYLDEDRIGREMELGYAAALAGDPRSR